MTTDREMLDALYRLDFGAFAYGAYEVVHPGEPLDSNWHIDSLCYRLAGMGTGRFPGRLVINLPPRSLKSYLVSVAFVAWMLGRTPSLRIICASYSEDLANKFSRDCRALMESPFYKRVFRTRLNPKKSTEGEFETTQRGSRLATSVGGTLTGRGADILIVDDPTKANDANSQTALAAANEWFRNTAISRLNNQSASLVIVTQQRLHTNDLSGTLLDQGWPSLIIPAVATQDEEYVTADDEVYARPLGELLQTGRDTPAAIEETKRSVGSRIFAAQYQQNPTPPDGNMIKAAWLPRYPSTPPRKKFRSVVLSCDPAGKAGIKNDYTAITVTGIIEKELYLLHVCRGHWTVLQMQERILALASEWEVTHVIVEDTSSGMGLIQMLRERPGPGAIGRHPKDDKETRLSRHQGRFEAGRIILPAEALWLAEFENELLAFPNGRYDDQVDALLLSLDWLVEHERNLAPCVGPIIVTIPRVDPWACHH
jgi:predicted phage terminase large subunit-like protein